MRPLTAKEDLPQRLLDSENPTPTETDFPQQAHRAVPLFCVAKTTPSFFWFLSRRFAEATTLRLTTLTATLTLRNRL